MRKITVEMTPAQANSLVWALTLGLVTLSKGRAKKASRSLALVSQRIVDEIERVFPEETK